MPCATGSLNPVCVQLQQFQMNGNVIPHAWYHARCLQFPNGKPNLIAITLLGDLIYWYRLVEVRDEASGKLIGYHHKFASDKLQKNYRLWAEAFGFTQRQVEDAMVFLKKARLVTVELRACRTAFGTIPSCAYVEPNFEGVKAITYPEKVPDSGDDPANSRFPLEREADNSGGPGNAGTNQRIPLKREHSETTPETTIKNSDLPATAKKTPVSASGNYAQEGGSSFQTHPEMESQMQPEVSYAPKPNLRGPEQTQSRTEQTQSRPEQPSPFANSNSEKPEVSAEAFDVDDFQLTPPPASPPVKSPKAMAPKVNTPTPKTAPPAPDAPHVPNASEIFIDAFRQRGMQPPDMLKRHHHNLKHYRLSFPATFAQAVEDFIDSRWAADKAYDVGLLPTKVPASWAAAAGRLESPRHAATGPESAYAADAHPEWVTVYSEFEKWMYNMPGGVTPPAHLALQAKQAAEAAVTASSLPAVTAPLPVPEPNRRPNPFSPGLLARMAVAQAELQAQKRG